MLRLKEAWWRAFHTYNLRGRPSVLLSEHIVG
jgi:hypothetical protein